MELYSRRGKNMDLPAYLEKLALVRVFLFRTLASILTCSFSSKYFLRETDIWMRARDHPNISRIIGFLPSFGNDAFPAFVFQFFPLGDLRSYITREGARVSTKRRLFFVSIYTFKILLCSNSLPAT